MYILLQLMLLVFSFGTVCSKKAAGTDFLSFAFCMYYGLMILLLGVYAICWQQIIKYLPLSFAYANKSITIVWGIVWGYLFFKERITAGKIIGAVLVIIGVVVYAYADKKVESNE